MTISLISLGSEVYTKPFGLPKKFLWEVLDLEEGVRIKLFSSAWSRKSLNVNHKDICAFVHLEKAFDRIVRTIMGDTSPVQCEHSAWVRARMSP